MYQTLVFTAHCVANNLNCESNLATVTHITHAIECKSWISKRI